jgi:acyl carrier protein
MRGSLTSPSEESIVPSVEERVIEIVCENLGVNKEQVTRSTSFADDMGADSLDIVELVMELEEEFDINIPDEQAEKIKTVGEAVEHIKMAIRSKPADGGAK